MHTVASAPSRSREAHNALFDRLRTPVVVDAAGRSLNADSRERAIELAGRAEAQLRELCAASVELLLAPHAASLAVFDDGCAIELELDDRRTLWIALDARALRSVVDGLALRHLGLRGVGELTGAERGLLEFAALACVERCGGARVRRFVHGRDLARVALEARATALEFELHCGAGGGRARALVELESGEPPLLLAQARETEDLELRVALPSLSIAREEHAALACGDVLLLGADSLAGFASQLELVTPGGWRVAPAELVSDRAATLVVRVGALEPSVLLRRSAPPGRVTIAPFIAVRRMERATFERWRAGDELALDKRPSAAVDLLSGDGLCWTGELVRVAGELGVRVCSTEAAPLERP